MMDGIQNLLIYCVVAMGNAFFGAFSLRSHLFVLEKIIMKQIPDYSNTPIFKKSFTLEGKSLDELTDTARKNFVELCKIIEVDPFFKEKCRKKLDNFLDLSAACIRFSVLEGAEISLYTDGKDNAIIYVIAENFYLGHPSLIVLNKLSLSALDMAISPDGEKCVISFGFDFSKDKISLTDYI